MLENKPMLKKVLLYAAVGVAAIVFALFAISYSQPGDAVPQEYRDTILSHQSGGNSASSWQPSPTRSAPSPSFDTGGTAPAPASESGGFSAGEKTGNSMNQAGVVAPRKVVKTGALALLVKKAEEAAGKSAAIAEKLGGYVEDKNIYNVSEESKAGSITLKVPASTFDEALVQLKGIAIKTNKEEVSAADVTAQYTDLEARLKSLKAQEAQYLTVLKDAHTVEDILNVTERLSGVRSDIERMEAAIKDLSGQVEMSSIAVLFTEEADVQVFGIEWKPLFTLKQAFRDMLGGLAGYVEALVGFVFILPVLALWGVTFIAGLWVAWKLFRFIKRKFFSPSL